MRAQLLAIFFVLDLVYLLLLLRQFIGGHSHNKSHLAYYLDFEKDPWKRKESYDLKMWPKR